MCYISVVDEPPTNARVINRKGEGLLVSVISSLMECLVRLRDVFSFNEVKLEKDPEEEGLYILTFKIDSKSYRPPEDLENIIAELDSSLSDIGRVKERGVSEEQMDAWAYIELPLEKIEEFIGRVKEQGHVLGSLEIKNDVVGALLYPRGSLSGFTIKLCYEVASHLPEIVKSFSVVGYELHGDHLDISMFISTKKECTPVHVHSHEEGEEE